MGQLSAHLDVRELCRRRAVVGTVAQFGTRDEDRTPVLGTIQILLTVPFASPCSVEDFGCAGFVDLLLAPAPEVKQHHGQRLLSTGC